MVHLFVCRILCWQISSHVKIWNPCCVCAVQHLSRSWLDAAAAAVKRVVNKCKKVVTDWGVCSACGGSSWAVQAWSWNIRVCLLGLKIIMWDFKASASSRAEGKCGFWNFTTNVSTKNFTCYLIKIVILLLGFVYSKSLNYIVSLF